MRIHAVDAVNHGFGIRETFFVKLMTAPSILRPVTPVQYNVVNRELPVPEAFEGRKHFIGCLVALSALPVTHRPFRHDRGFAGELAVTADNLVRVCS